MWMDARNPWQRFQLNFPSLELLRLKEDWMIKGAWFLIHRHAIPLRRWWRQTNQILWQCKLGFWLVEGYTSLSMQNVIFEFLLLLPQLVYSWSGLHFSDSNCPTWVAKIFQIFVLPFTYLLHWCFCWRIYIFLSVVFLICANFCAIDTSVGALACGFLCKLCQKLHPTEPFRHCNFVSIRGSDGGGGGGWGWPKSKAKRASQAAGKRAKTVNIAPNGNALQEEQQQHQQEQQQLQPRDRWSNTICVLIVFHTHVAFLCRKRGVPGCLCWPHSHT